MINLKIEEAVRRLNSENVGIRGIARLLGISPTTVNRIILQLASLVKRPTYLKYGQEYELDELWTFCQKKKREVWIIWAINRKSRQVIDVVVGARNQENIQKLLDRLKTLHPKRIRTDRWPGYTGLFLDFPKGVHRAGRRITNRIERQGATLRCHIKRLNRGTLSFPKSLRALEASLLLYFQVCNWRLYRNGFQAHNAIF